MNGVQRRNVGHVKDGLDGVYVGRPSKYGNPLRLDREEDRADVVLGYADWLRANPELIREARRELRGKRLTCWCYPKLCHADVLDAFVNIGSKEE